MPLILPGNDDEPITVRDLIVRLLDFSPDDTVTIEIHGYGTASPGTIVGVLCESGDRTIIQVAPCES